MALLAGWLTLLSIAGVTVALVMMIVRFVFKRGWTKKKIWILGTMSLVLLMTGVVTGVSSAPDDYEVKKQVTQNKTTIDKLAVPEKTVVPRSKPEPTKPTVSEKSTQSQQDQELEKAIGTKDKTDDLLKNIVTTVETQQMYDPEGRQKAVVWVENKTTYVFSGQLTIMIRSEEFSRGVEIFTVEDLKPGKRTWGIMWLRTSFMGEDTGCGTEPEIEWSDVEFK